MMDYLDLKEMRNERLQLPINDTQKIEITKIQLKPISTHHLVILETFLNHTQLKKILPSLFASHKKEKQ